MGSESKVFTSWPVIISKKRCDTQIFSLADSYSLEYASIGSQLAPRRFKLKVGWCKRDDLKPLLPYYPNVSDIDVFRFWIGWLNHHVTGLSTAYVCLFEPPTAFPDMNDLMNPMNFYYVWGSTHQKLSKMWVFYLFLSPPHDFRFHNVDSKVSGNGGRHWLQWCKKCSSDLIPKTCTFKRSPWEMFSTSVNVCHEPSLQLLLRLLKAESIMCNATGAVDVLEGFIQNQGHQTYSCIIPSFPKLTAIDQQFPVSP